ncbi:MAG: hypothetical protein C4334_14185 [Pyrinomonas sp.]|uniref:hypothetical protein n=1 Tax=Pyrinomonas sp. TaxID=2080306 RepID=UPI003327B4C6
MNERHETEPPLEAQPERAEGLMLRNEPPPHEETERISSTIREALQRIPESLGAIGRDISRTIERALAAKDEYMIAVKLSAEAQEKLEKLVQAGVFRSRAEAASYLIDEGIKAQAALFERVDQKLAEIEKLRTELRSIINQPPSS